MTETKKRKSNRIKRRVLNLFILLCFTAAAYLFYQSVMTKLDEKNSNEIYSEIEELYAEGIAIEFDPVLSTEPSPTSAPEPSPIVTQKPIVTAQPEPTQTVDPGPGDTIPQQTTLDRSIIT